MPTLTGISAPPRFALHELAYLLVGRDDPSAVKTREVFGIPEIEADGELFRTGLSSLVARGLIEENQESILPRNEAGLVGFGLGTATRWISVAIRATEGADIVVFVQGHKVAFMVRGAPAATFDFVPTRPDLTAASVALEAIAGQLAKLDEFAMMLRVATVSEDSALFVSRTAEHGFRIGLDPVFPGDENWPAPDLELTDATEAQVTDQITRFVTGETTE